MVKQYPYKLMISQQAEATYDESTGNFSENTSQWVEISKCRDEINGGGQKVITEDGEVYVYSAVIYLPKEAPKVLKGQRVLVLDEEGNIRLTGNSTLFKKEQLHARLWV